jgi:hypothetical protein
VVVSFGINDGDVVDWDLASTKQGEPVCADAEVMVTWVSYWYVNQGEQFLHGGSTYLVPTQSRQFTDRIQVHARCPAGVYFLSGDPIGMYRNDIPAGVQYPFPIASAANGWRGEIARHTWEPAPGCIQEIEPPATGDPVG